MDLKIRQIHHRPADRVRAYIFLNMLACYVEWHVREALRLFIAVGWVLRSVADSVADRTRSLLQGSDGPAPPSLRGAQRRSNLMGTPQIASALRASQRRRLLRRCAPRNDGDD